MTFYKSIILYTAFIIGGVISTGYGEISQPACFNYNTEALQNAPTYPEKPFPTAVQEENPSDPSQPSITRLENTPKVVPQSNLVLGQGLIVDHDHASLKFGNVLKLRNGLLIPYVDIGEAFMPAGITWGFGLSYCYENYSLSIGYEGMFNIPTDAGEELYPTINRGYLINKFEFAPVLLTFLLKYGQIWEHYRAPGSDDYYKNIFTGPEIGIFLQTSLFKTQFGDLGLYTYSVASYLEQIDVWTVLSFFNLDFTIVPKPFGELKLFHNIINIYASDPGQISEIRSMFFLTPFPVNSPRRFNNQKTTGFLAGAVSLGYRIFPFFSVKNPKNAWARPIYIAPYLHYGWGYDRFKPAGANTESTFSVSVHLGYKLGGVGSVSTAVGWNIDEGVIISLIINF
ncbi:hypothetical protein COTS27_01158 [Spirochaetota bacterium]|nr:hypothetical protein COTS27_01158 [Spirochaetota bacterium]